MGRQDDLVQATSRPGHPLVSLARLAVKRYVRSGVIIGPPCEPVPEMAGRAGVFVSIKKRRELRGCVGTFAPARPTVAEEIIHNAISSATRDPRFPPVTEDELMLLTYSIDVLGQPEPVANPGLLDPQRFGVIVTCGSRRGLLLPDLEGIDSVDQQLAIARAKAGILPYERAEILRFQVRRYT